jgi:hypothetical protein
MLKRTKRSTAKLLFGVVVAATLAGGLGVATVAAAGGPEGSRGGQESNIEAMPLADLSDAEVEGILFMREEEKLARDVYQTLFEIWEQPVFENIASSEQAHMDALKTLIDRYGLDDPVAGNDVGVFTDTTLQKLYNDLVEDGRESLVSALRVGAAIEELDILDLEDYMGDTEAADVLQVYENLLRGSRNHLRAFVDTLERQAGETYEPQYLGTEAYDDILAEQVETGRRAGRAAQGSQDGQPDQQEWSSGAASNGNSQSGTGAGRGNRTNVAPRGAGQDDCLQQ